MFGHQTRVFARQLQAQTRLPSYALPSRRKFVSSTLQSCANGLIDLALAIPYPPSLPAYSSTIILVTVLSRLFLTLPVSIWAKKNEWEIESVHAELQQLKPVLAKEAMRSMRQERIRGTKEELNIENRARTANLLKEKHKSLLAEKKISLPLNLLLPPLTQLPVFVGTTLIVQHASHAPSPLEAEAFLSLTSLTHADPTLMLPIALGVITLANVESSTWFMSDSKRAAETYREGVRAKQLERGEKLKLDLGMIVKPALRVASVVRIMIGALVPGSVIISWVTSATFGLFQTWAFDWWDRRRRAREPPPVPLKSVQDKLQTNQKISRR